MSTTHPSESVAEALRLLLGHVDYRRGACRSTDEIGAVLPEDVLAQCREILAGARVVS